MRIDFLDKVKKAMLLLDKTEDDVEATRCGLFLIQSVPLLVKELESSYKVVEAAKTYIEEINDTVSNENYKRLTSLIDELDNKK